MKKRHLVAPLMLAVWMNLPTLAADRPEFTISDLSVEGEIVKENVTFSMRFVVDVEKKGVEIPLVEGDVAFLEASFPSRTELRREGRLLLLKMDRTGRQEVSLRFASLPRRDGDWRHTDFRIPQATVRKLAMGIDRPDLKVEFPGALRVSREGGPDDASRVMAYLGATDVFSVRWKPQVRALDADLVVACAASTIASASVGALHIDNVFHYEVVQGGLKHLELSLPEDINVTRVSGEDILEWRIDVREQGPDRLVVDLNQVHESDYTLRVESDRILPPFPMETDLPVITPDGVIRNSGFLAIGTDSAVKLLVRNATGLTQIDRSAFSSVSQEGDTPRALPARSVFVYQYANLPYRLRLSAEDIVTAFSCEERLVLSLSDRDVSLDATVELDVRDAPAREAVVETDPAWTVANVTGATVSDYTVHESDGKRLVTVFFREAILGRGLFSVRLERTLPADVREFSAPMFRVRDAGAERGFVVLTAEKGTRLLPETEEGLRAVQTGSLPIRLPDAQRAFRFKAGNWQLALKIEDTTPSVHTELFHLVSLGEGALYGSCSITYSIDGAPVRILTLTIPEEYGHVELVGRDIRNWTQDGDTWTVVMQEKLLGDYTLLVTYDQPFSVEGDEIVVGGISSVGTDSESGYVAVAGEASLGLTGAGERDSALMPIDRSEIPEAYALLINAPVLQSYRYISGPHAARLGVHRYPVQDTLRKVNDHTTIVSRISEEGEVVTEIEYFVKNTSDQYLRVTLPPESTLWSAAVDGRSVKALEAGEAGAILIPLHRRLDPNQPSRVRIEYAQSKGELGWRRNLSLTAPAVAAQSVFGRWEIRTPENYAVSGAGGNMMAEPVPVATGVLALTQRTLSLAGLILREAGAWVWVACLLLVGFCWMGFLKGYGRHVFVGTLIVLIGGASVVFGTMVLTGGNHGLERCLASVVDAGTPPREIAFTRMVSMADRELNIGLSVVPNWVGAGGSAIHGALGIGLGLLLGIGATLKRQPLLLAAGVTAMVWGMSQTLVTVQILVVLLTVGIPVWIGVLAVRGSNRAGRTRRDRRVVEDDPPPMITPPPLGAEGAASLAILAMIAGSMLGSSAVVAVSQQQVEAPIIVPEIQDTAVLRLESIQVEVDVSPAQHGEASIANLECVLDLTVREPGSFRLLPPGFVMTGVDLPSSRYLRVIPDEHGTWLHADRKGSHQITYRYLAEVNAHDGGYHLNLDIPEALKNQVVLRLADEEMDIYSPEAVLLDTTDLDIGSESRIVFAPARTVGVGWKPRLRQTGEEKALYFAEINTIFLFDAGVVQGKNTVRYQIAQGEVQIFRLAIPEAMSVTAVQGRGLSTWRFDPRTHELEAVLDRAVSGNYDLQVATQVTEEGLPYTEELGVPEVVGAERQRGTVSVSVPSSVQVRVADTLGLSSMNISDAPGASAPIKRAFRYHQLPASLTVEAEPVLAELRVTEHAQLDVSDERSVLSTRLTVAITKSGVFSVGLMIPDNFDVESLSGQDVSHWDEVGEAPHRVQVHFDKQIQGERELQLVLARSGKGIQKTIRVPRVSVENALKHTGTLLVSGERGVRLFTAARDGVSEVNPRELGANTTGYLGFRLLRPDWTVDLETDVLEPVVKADVVQQVEIGDGMLQAHCFVQYEIDNAGLKTLQFRSPEPGTALTFSGRHITEFRELDPASGLWQVDLDAKVENSYRLEVRYQVPLAAGPGGQADVRPLLTVNTQSQSGFVVIQARGRLRITPTTVSPGLKEENARNIPAEFGAGDLSDAILCYRSTRPDYTISLDMVRHDSAPMLPASVTQVQLTSVVAEDGHMATRANLRMSMGELRFLEMTLPEDARMWAVFVDTQPVVPLIRDGAILIPLEEASNPNHVEIEAIYGGVATTTRFGRRQRVDGPEFNLPLRDIQWKFYLPPSRRYFGFEGTMQRVAGRELPQVLQFDARTYQEQAQQEVAQNLWRAEEEMRLGEEYANQGQQLKARKAFENAMYNSQSASEVNEDARIQFRNLARRQAVVGLVNRRDNLKKKLNLGTQAEEVIPQQWTTQDGMKIEASLEEKDNYALNVVAEKILDQQSAAAGAAPAIRVTMPLHGQALDFHRDLQIHPFADLNVEFRSRPKGVSGRLMSTALLAGVFVSVRLASGSRRRSPDQKLKNTEAL